MSTSNCYAVNMTQLCARLDAGQTLALKGFIMKSSRSYLVATIGIKHHLIPIQSGLSNGITRINPVSSVQEYVGTNIDAATNVFVGDEFHEAYIDGNVIHYHYSSSKPYMKQIKQDLLSDYNTNFTKVRAAGRMSNELVLITQNQATNQFTKVTMRNEPQGATSILKTSNYTDSNKVPTTIGSLDALTYVTCVQDANSRYDICSYSNNEINPYYATSKRFLGCPLNIEEFCHDIRLDAAAKVGDKFHLIQGRWAYDLVNGSLAPKVHERFVYTDAAYSEEDGNFCSIRSDPHGLTRGIFCTNSDQTDLPTQMDNIDAAFRVSDFIYMLGSNFIYIFNSNLIFNRSSQISAMFDGVPNDVDATLYDSQTDHLYLFKYDNFYRTKIVFNKTNEIVDVFKTSALIANCQTTSSTTSNTHMKPKIDRKRNSIILVVILVMVILVISAIIFGIYMVRKKAVVSVKPSSNIKSDIKSKGSGMSETLSVPPNPLRGKSTISSLPKPIEA